MCTQDNENKNLEPTPDAPNKTDAQGGSDIPPSAPIDYSKQINELHSQLDSVLSIVNELKNNIKEGNKDVNESIKIKTYY